MPNKNDDMCQLPAVKVKATTLPPEAWDPLTEETTSHNESQKKYHLLLYKAASIFRNLFSREAFLKIHGRQHCIGYIVSVSLSLYPPGKCELEADNRHFLNSARMYPLPGFSAASCARYLLAGQLCIGWKISEPSLHPKFARVSCPGGQ